MQNFTTFFDKNYLSRGLVLIESLQKNSDKFCLFVLCLDNFTADYFSQNKTKYPQVTTLSLSEIEDFDNELKQCKANRKLIEYYFTLSPCLPLYLLKKNNLSHICTLDADIKFYNNPEKLFKYLDNNSIVITPHKFSKGLENKEISGKYNVSFQIFKNDETALQCLETWRKQCITWCKDEIDIENNRFADQKYLDNWEDTYKSNIKILFDNVSGLANWNLNNYLIKKEKNLFFSNNERIIFYHFHHNNFLNKYWATTGFNNYRVLKQKGITQLYLDYWNNILKYNKSLNFKSENFIRTNILQTNLILTLINEKIVYFRLSKNKIIWINFKKVPTKVKIILKKIYG